MQIPTASPVIPEFPNPHLMHTNTKLCCFSISCVQQRTLIHHLNHFLHQSSQNKVNRGECGKKQISSLLQKSEYFTRNGSLNLRTKDILTNDLLLLELLKSKVTWAECPAPAKERTENWIQLKMSLGSPVQTQPNHSCQMRWRYRAHRALLV